MTKLVSIAAAALALAAATAPARAVVVTVTYSGTAIGTDGLDLFGLAGGAATPQAFTAVFRFDPDRGDGPFGGPTYDSTFNLSAGNGPLSPSLGGWISIGGVRFDVAGYSYANVAAYDNPYLGGRWQTHYFADTGYYDTATYPGDYRDTSLGSFIISSDPASTLPFSLATAFGYTAAPGDFVGGTFSHAVIERGTGATLLSTYYDLTPTSLTYAVDATAPVPEPATWAMMLAGFGAAAAIAWRRRRAAAA